MAATDARTRYIFVDSLRGIAATWVLLYHAYKLIAKAGFAYPAPLHHVLMFGYLAVYVFFVISGFVIAQSIRGDRVTPSYVGRFAVRRAVRLDPPYWVTIALAITISAATSRSDGSESVPTGGAIVAHVFYLQSFFGYHHIVNVFWTLCYEVQLYLVLIISVGVWQNLPGKREVTRAVVFGLLWLLSAVSVAGLIHPDAAWFITGWPWFFVGVVMNWYHHREVSRSRWVLIFLATALLIPVAPSRAGVALVTVAAIWWVSARGKLSTLSLGRVAQYLGKVSYSLYLIHMLVGTRLVAFLLERYGRPHLLQATAFLAADLLVSLAAAHLLHVVVERPAMELSARLRNRA